MRVREAIAEDADAIVAINDSVQRIHAQAHTRTFKYPADQNAVKAFFLERLAANEDLLLVAENADRTVLGYAWAAPRCLGESPFTFERRMLYIHHIAVAPGARRRGVATGLLRELENRAHQLDLDTVALDTWQFNTEAHAFFARLGFVPYRTDMWKHLNTTLQTDDDVQF